MKEKSKLYKCKETQENRWKEYTASQYILIMHSVRSNDHKHNLNKLEIWGTVSLDKSCLWTEKRSIKYFHLDGSK